MYIEVLQKARVLG